MACHSVLVTIIIAYLLAIAYGATNPVSHTSTSTNEKLPNSTTVINRVTTMTQEVTSRQAREVASKKYTIVVTPTSKTANNSSTEIGSNSGNADVDEETTSTVSIQTPAPNIKIQYFVANWQDDSIVLFWSIESDFDITNSSSLSWELSISQNTLHLPIIPINCSMENGNWQNHLITVLPKENIFICNNGDRNENFPINVMACALHNVTLIPIGSKNTETFHTQLKPIFTRHFKLNSVYHENENKLYISWISNSDQPANESCIENYRYELSISSLSDQHRHGYLKHFIEVSDVLPCTYYSMSVYTIDTIVGDNDKSFTYTGHTKPSALHTTDFHIQVKAANQTCILVGWWLDSKLINCIDWVRFLLDPPAIHPEDELLEKQRYVDGKQIRPVEGEKWICRLKPGTKYALTLEFLGKDRKPMAMPHLEPITEYTSNAYDASTVGLIVVASALAIILVGFGVHLSRQWLTRHVQWSQRPNQSSHFQTSFFSNLGRKRAHPIKLRNLEAVTQRLRSSACHLLEMEFEDLNIIADARRHMDSCSAMQPENAIKNRYVNIIPYEHSRVSLNLLPDQPYSDYINASYIMGFNDPKEYIASQGPKSCTIQDFWRMIWEQNVQIIVMVTSLEERGKPKCDQYWPDNAENSLTLDNLTISHIDETDFENYTLRSLEIKANEDRKVVKHAFLKGWPDFGVPESPEILIRFIEVIRKLASETCSSPYPIVVHCSAGVGRTGTFIAVDWLMQEALIQKEIDIFSTVLRMRECRINMVQSEEQYEYVYRCLAHYVNTRLLSTITRVETNVSEAATLLTNGSNAAFVESVETNVS